MSPKVISNAAAAKILRCYESEVASVDKAAEGIVATTTDGQRYVLTDTEGYGAYEWLKPPLNAPQRFAHAEPAAEPEPAPVAVEAKPVEKMSVAELKAHAAALGVDLGGAKKKPDIVALLTAPAADETVEPELEDEGADDEDGDE